MDSTPGLGFNSAVRTHTLDTNDIGQTEWLLASPLKNWKILLEQFFCMHAFPGGNYHNQNRAKCFLVFSPILLPTPSLYYAAIHQLHQSHPFNGPFPGLPRWAGTRKVKPIWILLKQETVSGSGISWAICKSAPRSRQITTPAPHHSVFYRLDALPATQPTASKHWRQLHQSPS